MGIVEGITEWLPISSTGHMILLEQIIKFNASEAQLWQNTMPKAKLLS